MHVWFRYQKYREEFTHDGRDRSPSTRRRSAPSSRSRAPSAGIRRRPRRWAGPGRLHPRLVPAPVPEVPRARSGFRGTDMVFDDPTASHERRAVRPPVPRRPHRWPALVLTAGLGTRLRPLSAVRAKPACRWPACRWSAASCAGWPRAASRRGPQPAPPARRRSPRPSATARPSASRVRYSWERAVLGQRRRPGAGRCRCSTPTVLRRQRRHADRCRSRGAGRAHVAQRRPRDDGARSPTRIRCTTAAWSVDDDGARDRVLRAAARRIAGWHFVGVQAVEARSSRRSTR